MPPLLIDFHQMVDMALATPEMGFINVPVLNSLLHCLVHQLSLAAHRIEFHGAHHAYMEQIIPTIPSMSPVVLKEFSVKNPQQPDEARNEVAPPPKSTPVKTVIAIYANTNATGMPSAGYPLSPLHIMSTTDLEVLKNRVASIHDALATVLPDNNQLLHSTEDDCATGSLVRMNRIINTAKRMDAVEIGLRKLAQMVTFLATTCGKPCDCLDEEQLTDDGVSSTGSESTGNAAEDVANVTTYFPGSTPTAQIGYDLEGNGNDLALVKVKNRDQRVIDSSSELSVVKVKNRNQNVDRSDERQEQATADKKKKVQHDGKEEVSDDNRPKSAIKNSSKKTNKNEPMTIEPSIKGDPETVNKHTVTDPYNSTKLGKNKKQQTAAEIASYKSGDGDSEFFIPGLPSDLDYDESGPKPNNGESGANKNKNNTPDKDKMISKPGKQNKKLDKLNDDGAPQACSEEFKQEMLDLLDALTKQLDDVQTRGEENRAALELRLNNFETTFASLIEATEEEFRCILNKHHNLFLQTMIEVQDMLDAKVDKLSIPQLKQFLVDHLNEFRGSLEYFQREFGMVKDAAGTTTRRLRNLDCLSCQQPVFQLDREHPPYVPLTKGATPFRVIPAPPEKRYCGGGHTVTTAVERRMIEGNFIQQYGASGNAKDVEMGAGTDGVLYRVREGCPCRKSKGEVGKIG